jgi:hypothetical protein
MRYAQYVEVVVWGNDDAEKKLQTSKASNRFRPGQGVLHQNEKI